MLPITPNDTLVSDHNLESGENIRVWTGHEEEEEEVAWCAPPSVAQK